MTDLEEKFLKKNVPGKYSQWADYQDDDEPKRYIDDGGDEEDEQQQQNELDSGALDNKPNSYQRYTTTKKQGKNTGVKGILSDYRESKRFEKLENEEKQIERSDAFRRETEGSILNLGEQSISIAAEIQKKKEEGRGESDSESDDSDFLDDDEFLQSYRRTRLLQMEKEKLNVYPVYGSVTEVDSLIKFADIIDQADSRVYCIFHLYNDSIPCCRLMNEHLQHIVKDIGTCRFFRLEACKVKENFDSVGFPCVLIYQGGKEVANLTPITEMMESSARDRFTIEDVKAVIMSFGIRDSRSS